MQIERTPMGERSGQGVERVSLVAEAPDGLRVVLTSYGASVASVKIRDREGILREITLGHDSLEAFAGCRAYMGSTVGRVANRIAGAAFSVEGRRFELCANDRGRHCLHGGPSGFHQAVWQIASIFDLGETAEVAFTHLSPHLEGGFPGNLSARAVFRVSRDTLSVDYLASADRPTHASLTNHTYWNLAGDESRVLDQELAIHADSVLEIDEDLIPTGRVLSVERTPLDLRKGKRIGDVLQGFGDVDHCFLIRGAGLREAARLSCEQTGIGVVLETDQPGLQVYTGNFLEGVPFRRGSARRHQAVCLEPEDLPNRINTPAFAPRLLEPGARYTCRIRYRFSVGSLSRHS